jgi:CDP-glucose 4,6-dehydratase
VSDRHVVASQASVPARGHLDRAFWRGRRVFVTGHTGFKGSWLTLWLNSLGAEQTGYALEPPTEPSLYVQARVSACGRSVVGDVRDVSRLKQAVADCRPEVVLHMAAQSVVKRGYTDPVETYSTNVMGTVNILEAVRALDAPCVVINVTTDKCYAHRASGPGYREDEPMGGNDPYSNSKGCSELVTASYRTSFFSHGIGAPGRVAVATARAGNAIGGGDWTPNQLIPDLMRSFAAARSCPIRSPQGVRPWQFVLEPLRGYLVLAQALSSDPARYASGWNFGPADADARPVSWIADRLRTAWGPNAEWHVDGSPAFAEAAVLRLDVTKAAEQLGWRPCVKLADALDWIVDWYRAWVSGDDLRAVTEQQLRRYESVVTSRVPAAGETEAS